MVEENTTISTPGKAVGSNAMVKEATDLTIKADVKKATKADNTHSLTIGLLSGCLLFD